MAVEELRVSGSVKLRGPLKLGTAGVSGSLSVEGDIETEVLEVSGSARISGNLKSGEVRASGSLSVKGSIEATELKISGSGEVSGRIKAGILEVSGSLRALNVEASEARINGAARVERLAGGRVFIGKDSEVSGLVVGCYVEVGRDAEVERVVGYSVVVRRGAEVDYIEARSVVVERGAEVEDLRYIEKAEVHEGAYVHLQTKVSELSEKVVCEE